MTASSTAPPSLTVVVFHGDDVTAPFGIVNDEANELTVDSLTSVRPFSSSAVTGLQHVRQWSRFSTIRRNRRFVGADDRHVQSR